MLDLALDPGRHAWLLDTTGGDATALAELTATQDAILAAASPDLPQLTRIVLCRVSLSERNASLPVAVPVVWALLGRVDRPGRWPSPCGAGARRWRSPGWRGRWP
jgi:hypothetical protein